MTPKTYCMTSNVFGAGPSGFNATNALRQCADDGIGTCDDAIIRSVHDNFYVDDYIISVSTEKKAIEFVREIRRLLAAGGF